LDCGRAGKHPKTENGFRDATTDTDVILQWLRRWPGCNWAVPTGEKSGVFVLDIDGDAGRTSLAALEAEHGPLPRTITVATGREDDGEHRWFTYPSGCAVKSTVGNLGLGLDIRANGGYVIIPPSRHMTGKNYQWVDVNLPLADPPEWLIDAAVSDHRGAGIKGVGKPRQPRYGHVPCFDEPILKGARNSTLTRAAGVLRRRGKDESGIRTVLHKMNQEQCRPPLPDEEVNKIAASISRQEYAPKQKSIPQMPLSDFIFSAASRNIEKYEKHKNKNSGRFKSPLFDFAREVKTRADFVSADGLQAALIVDSVLKSRHQVSDPWEVVFGEICDDPRAEFIGSWDRVRVPGVGDALTQAYYQSKRFPLRPIKFYSRTYTEFISLAAQLQLNFPDVPIGLPVQRIAQLIRVDRKTVGQYRRWAVLQGILTQVGEYVLHKMAQEYLFNVAMFNWETGEQIHTSPEEITFSPETQA